MSNKFDFDEIIPVVGNKFLNVTPNKDDKNILLIKEDNNKHDSDAVAIYSKRKNGLVKLGYIIRDKNVYVRNIMDNIKTLRLIRSSDKNIDGDYYYYLAINLN